MPALDELIDTGLIRVIDLAVVSKDGNGNVTIFESSELPVELADALDKLDFELPGMLSEADLLLFQKENTHMATLTVWKFATAAGAHNAHEKLGELSKLQLIQVQDAAIVSWPVGKKSPTTQNFGSMTGRGALSGAFWGMLFGLIFFVPFFGLAIGAAMGALSGKFADYGINDAFIKEVREQVTEGTSALFLLTSGAVQDRVAEAFQGVSMELIQSNLSSEQEAQLLADFGD